MVDEYGYELIGFYPVLGGMVNALAVSTRIIIPVQTEFLALLRFGSYAQNNRFNDK